MTAFWHYLPNLTTEQLVIAGRIDHSMLLTRSIGGVLRDCFVAPGHAVVLQSHRGPDGGSGVLIYPTPADGSVPVQPGYDPDRQTWRQIGDGSQRWIGWLTDHPPAPEDLQRREMIGGLPCSDACGRRWQIPIARSPDNPRGMLPVAYGFDSDDNPKVGVSARFSRFWADSLRLWDLIETATDVSGGAFRQSFSDADDLFVFGMVCTALEINYRVDRHVLATLDKITPSFLDRDTVVWAANSICDVFKFREFREAQKKTESQSVDSGSTSTSSEPADTPSIDRAEESKPS